METPLAGIRVVDFSSGPAGGLATTVLSDFGAEVIKVEPPDGDRFRSLAASPFWLRGKQSVVLDLKVPENRATAQQLIATADVVVVSGPPSRARKFGLDSATLCERFPALIHCAITGWGVDGPYAELPGYEGIIAAKAGRLTSFSVQLGKGRPVYAAVPVATHAASQAAVQGILAAVYRRTLTGRGDRVEASLVQGLMPFELVDLLSRQIAERDGRTFVRIRDASPMPTLNYHPLRTSDGGWIQCGNLLEHLFYSFLDAVDLLGEFLIDEKFQGSPAVWSAEATEEARDRMLVRMQERTTDEWMQIFAENGNVAAEPIVTTTEAITHADLVEGRCLVSVDDPIHGATTQIGPIAELVDTPAAVLAGAPTIGQHTEQVLGALANNDQADEQADEQADGAAPVAMGTNPAGRPLEGVTILDLSTIIAAPLAIVMLADLGARVIKVEPLAGDPFRGLAIEGRMAVKTNVGKESICINLKTPAGQALLHELVADADVLVHNFRGKVPEKLGMGYEQLHAINPDLIWAVVNGYSPHGPGAKRPATHPVMGAATGGVAWQAGQALTADCPTLADVREYSRQIMAANEANPDPNTSVVAASAILLALVARQRTDARGQMVRINMQVANAWANGDDFLAYDNKPSRLPVDAGYHGISPTYRLYEAAEGWVFLAATSDRESEALRSALDLSGELTAQALGDVFATKTATEWESVLVPQGVACVRADGVDIDRFIAADPHMVANGWAPVVDHERFGRLQRWGPIVTVGGLNPAYGSAPLAGQHTDVLLSALGKTADEIAQLRADKIVSSEAV